MYKIFILILFIYFTYVFAPKIPVLEILNDNLQAWDELSGNDFELLTYHKLFVPLIFDVKYKKATRNGEILSTLNRLFQALNKGHLFKLLFDKPPIRHKYLGNIFYRHLAYSLVNYLELENDYYYWINDYKLPENAINDEIASGLDDFIVYFISKMNNMEKEEKDFVVANSVSEVLLSLQACNNFQATLLKISKKT